VRSGTLGARPKMMPQSVFLAVILAATILGAAQGNSLQVDAQSVNRVGLVVDFGDRHITRCVEFTESEITGLDVLSRAGLNLMVDASNPMGVIVCDINNTSGCPGSNCFCQCQGSPCVYWAYHYLEGASWRYSLLGASSRKVRNGDVEGWGWGEGALNNSGAQPPVIPFDQICAPPVTDTPVPTDTPIPPTDTPVPADTPVPTDTPGPTAVPAPEAWFRLDANPIAAGSCTMLRWDTSHGQQVYLDEGAVAMIGSREVCPATPTDYELRVVGLEEERTYRLTLGVTGVVAATATWQQTMPAGSPSPTSVAAEVTPALASTVAQATGAAPAPPASATDSPTGATPLPTATRSSPSTATPDRSPTPAQIAQIQPTATAAQVVRMEDVEPERRLESKETSSPLLPIGYAAFSLIVGGLLGWLVYVLRVRGRRV